MLFHVRLPNGSALSCERADRDVTSRCHAARRQEPPASEASLSGDAARTLSALGSCSALLDGAPAMLGRIEPTTRAVRRAENPFDRIAVITPRDTMPEDTAVAVGASHAKAQRSEDREDRRRGGEKR